MKISYDIPCVVVTHNRNTAILVERSGDLIKFIPLVGEAGFEVEELPVSQFSQLYEVLVDYPAARAAQLYAGYAQSLGASKSVMEYLGHIIKLSPKEIEMATAKKTAAKAAPEKATKTAAKPAAKSAAKATKAPKAEKAVKEAGAPRESAAQMFKDLIMEGKLNDDKIFEKVQAKFGLDEKKRSYVAWYRNDLTKKGMNPPEAK